MAVDFESVCIVTDYICSNTTGLDEHMVNTSFNRLVVSYLKVLQEICRLYCVALCENQLGQ